MKTLLYLFGIIGSSLALSLYISSSINLEAQATVVPQKPIIVAEVQAEEIHASSDEFSNIIIDLPAHYKALTIEVLKKIPTENRASLKKIVADNAPNARRGLASSRSIYLGIKNISSDEEFIRVLTHELGHTADLGTLTAKNTQTASEFKDGSTPVYESDPSLTFYRLCFLNETDRNTVCSSQDFVSGYAASDPFEDFAESYLLFIENNQSFQDMAKTNIILKKKYDFLAQTVFHNNYSLTGKLQNTLTTERVWDMTQAF